MTSIENPYPASAVAIYGTALAPTATFTFMRDAFKLLQDYLEGYPDTSCALALSGGHGSGKTHLLSWLSAEIAKIRHSQAKPVYVKTNDDDPVNLYNQMLRNWSREDLLAVQRQALIGLGAREAQGVQATASVGRSIQDFDSLGRAVEDKVLDLNALYISLRDELVSSASHSAADTSRRMAAAIGLLDDPTYGEGAFGWLRGEAVDGLPNEALQSGLFGNRAEAGDTAIFGLETLAVLFRLAGMPLIILIDQIENFLTEADIAGKSSNLKKLIEQLRSQCAAIVMAGTPTGWEKLPRDVGPRLSTREPLTVGALTVEECAHLLQVPLEVRLGTDVTLPPETAVTVHELSSGNAREILRIAHQAFAATGGSLAAFSRDVLIKAADTSGTLADRRVLARQLIEQVAKAEGLTLIPGSGRVEYEVRAGGGGALSIMLVVAADATSESVLARELTETLRTAKDPAGSFLVITIGYSSERVRTLLEVVVEIVAFDEVSLKPILRERFKALRTAVEPARTSDDEAMLAERLGQLDQVLAEIQQARADSDRKIAEMIEARTVAAAEPERQAAEMKTRYELRDGLNALGNALATYHAEDERHIIRRLLIANEINVKDGNFDFLGSLFLDTLDLERIHIGGRSSDGISTWSPEGPPSIHEKALTGLRGLRADIITAMRRVLTEQSAPGRSPRVARLMQTGLPAMAGFITSYLMITFIRYSRALEYYHSPRPFGERLSRPRWEDMLISVDLGVILLSLLIGGLMGLTTFFVIETLARPDRRYGRLRKRLTDIRRTLERMESPD